ncbi:cation-translocating P-type ATPase [uncultured Legionella sp.]|uniref:heavy metal translocating P-type ATPase n=1 Tax=uncultured Legionella sp. TaxID=210934 RepID=UPI00261C62D9|nr:HAD-IC family P-type ATPase [uncultured Legionella sp.]
MSHINFRFYFTEDASLLEPEKTQEHIVQILNETKDLQFIRAAFDLTGQRKSISLVCKSNAPTITQTRIRELLWAQEIALGEHMEVEPLKEDHEKGNEAHAHHPTPDAPGKKREKPHKHHKHNHHDHDHSHNHGHDHAHSHGHHHGHEHDNHWLKATLGLIWGAGLLILAIASFNIPALAYYTITGLTTLMTLYLGSTVYKSAWNALLELKWDTTTLYTISTLTIVGVSVASMFIPGLPMMFEAAPLVLGFWHLGEGIEHSLVGEISHKLDVRDCVPPSILLRGNPDKEISVKKLIPNDIIVVKQGGIIPVDGVLTQKTLLYTTRIDGSPDLKVFKPGDTVKAGMRLADHLSSVEMRVSKTYQNSYLSLIAKNIAKANDDKAPVEEFANTILNYFIPGLLGIALVSGVVIGTVFTSALALQCVISVLVSACPCALSLITPMAVKIGMKKASEHGIHFNNGKALQASADIDTVVFDLNGTLTQGKAAVSALQISDKKFLNHIALLEEQSEHPAAQIIKSYIHAQNIVSSEPLTLDIDSIDKTHHSGIKGLINGETFLVGNKDMLMANGITEIDPPYNNPENGSVYLVRGTTVIGQIALTDPLRQDAVTTINQLKKQGKSVHICTGADRATAEQYAALLGIPKENICANTVGVASKPGEISKTSYIQQLKRKGYKVAMVGDAANDLTAIKYAHMGIAVKSSIGDDITAQYAGIVVQQGLLFPIATAFDVAQKTKDNIYQNLFISLTYNSMITMASAGLFIAIGFAVNPVLGVALMVLESTIVLANLYSFKQQDIVCIKSNGKNAVLDEEYTSGTTANVLNALGHRILPENNSTNTPGPWAAAQKTEPLFAPIRPVSKPEINQEDGYSIDLTN